MNRIKYYMIGLILCFVTVGVIECFELETIYAADSGHYQLREIDENEMCSHDIISYIDWKLEGDCLYFQTDECAMSCFSHISTNDFETFDDLIGTETIKKAKKIVFDTPLFCFSSDYKYDTWDDKGNYTGNGFFKNSYPNIEEVEFISFCYSWEALRCFPNIKKVSFGVFWHIYDLSDMLKNLKSVKEYYMNGGYCEYDSWDKYIEDGITGNNEVVIEYSLKSDGWNKMKNSHKKGYLLKKQGAKSLKDADIDLKKCFYTYDGSAKTPTVKVKLGDKILVRDKDYTLEYENNYDDGIATIYIVGQNDYWDIVEMNYVILPYNPGMEAVYDDGAFIEGRFVYGITDEEDNEVEVYCPAKSGIKTADIPDTVKYDGVEYKVTSIGNKAFYRNRKLQSVEIGDNIESIENYAFYGCTKLADVKLGSNVEEIGASAFRKCTKLKSIVLPKRVSELGKNVFFGCKRLKNITIKSKKVIDIKKNAIKGISSKATIKVNSKKLVKAYSKRLTKKTGYKKTMTIKKK